MYSLDTRSGARDELRLMSFNMQVGIGTRRYRDYVLRGWRNVLPSMETKANLARIAGLLSQYDIVGLQEIDGGSRRSGYENQLEWLAHQADFGFWHLQVNRDLGHLAQHGLGLLSRFEPFDVHEHSLPGRIPGRGALLAKFGDRQDPLVVVVTHLALGARSRARQLGYLSDLTRDYRHVILMGDTNCSAEQLQRSVGQRAAHLQVQPQMLPTYPSWRPRRGIDHILVSRGIEVSRTEALDVQLSDHRPVAMRIRLPEPVHSELAQVS
jgi:endonuclease/exonuclease/phosphatase family metal-dependent hydrolase